MEVGQRDPVTGREMTGHEWNGIRELTRPFHVASDVSDRHASLGCRVVVPRPRLAARNDLHQGAAGADPRPVVARL